MTFTQKAIKRAFDLSLACVVVIIGIPIWLLLLMISAVLTLSWPLFAQKRIGKHGKVFRIYKLRTLKGSEIQSFPPMSKSSTLEWIREKRLDEFPQLFQIILNQMSWVGPRPDLPGYADRLTGADRELLKYKPGLTGPATLVYRNENELLLKQSQPLKYNDEILWPDKVQINLKFYRNYSFWSEFAILMKSLTK